VDAVAIGLVAAGPSAGEKDTGADADAVATGSADAMGDAPGGDETGAGPFTSGATRLGGLA
jgi:hypothetical protein